MSKPTAHKPTSRFRKIAHPPIYREEDLALARAQVTIHIRLDADTVQYFKAKAQCEGGGSQSLMNQHLRDTIWARHDLEQRVQLLKERLGLQA